VSAPSGPDQDERWFFLNGICTDHRIAHLNAKLVQKLFGRPITILYNATEGVWVDLVECAVGKAWDSVTEAAERNLDALLDALCDDHVRHVILVSHSQGTIIAAVLLKVLEEMLLAPRPPAAGEEKVSPERRVARKIASRAPAALAAHGRRPGHGRRPLVPADIGKLELYCFANCATSMEPFIRLTGPARVAPWIESYGNENDVVAKLGLLAPPHGIGSARIAGDRYRIPGAWGHLFNAHSAIPMFVRGATLEPFHDNLRGTPRLSAYLGGQPPPIP
jgi:pimeloyl-ACP methyl ester carboxylesterase